MTGSGTIDPGHIVAFQTFVHQPLKPRILQISRLRLLPSIAQTDVYKSIVARSSRSPALIVPAKCIRRQISA